MLLSEANSESYKTSKKDLFAKIVECFQKKSSILNVSQGSDHVSSSMIFFCLIWTSLLPVEIFHELLTSNFYDNCLKTKRKSHLSRICDPMGKT